MRTAWAQVAWTVLAAGAGLMAVSPAVAADREFNSVVSALEHRYAVQHQRIPFWGFASFCARVASVGTVRGMDLAEFENVGPRLTGSNLDTALQGELGSSWHRFVSSREQESGETTVIYSRLDDHKFFLLIASLDGESLSLVKLAMSEKQMLAWVRGDEWFKKRTGGPRP